MILSIILRNNTDGSSCTISPSNEKMAILRVLMELSVCSVSNLSAGMLGTHCLFMYNLPSYGK